MEKKKAKQVIKDPHGNPMDYKVSKLTVLKPKPKDDKTAKKKGKK